MKINKFQGDVTDVSAKNEPLIKRLVLTVLSYTPCPLICCRCDFLPVQRRLRTSCLHQRHEIIVRCDLHIIRYIGLMRQKYCGFIWMRIGPDQCLNFEPVYLLTHPKTMLSSHLKCCLLTKYSSLDMHPSGHNTSEGANTSNSKFEK